MRKPMFVLLAALGALTLTSGVRAEIEIEQWQTAEGARVLFYAAPQVPMLDVRATFDAGSGIRSGGTALIFTVLAVPVMIMDSFLRPVFISKGLETPLTRQISYFSKKIVKNIMKGNKFA